jgi:mycofactocin precursor
MTEATREAQVATVAREHPPAAAAGAEEAEQAPVLVEEDLLIEDVSIDGMCGVY